MKYKNYNILKILLVLVVIITIFLSINITRNNNKNKINIKYVNEINSILYEEVVFYDYNEKYTQYDIKKRIVNKDNLLINIFNYYNINDEYKVINVSLNNDTVIYEIEGNDNKLNYQAFKLIKLSLRSINIECLNIKLNNNNYII